MNREPGDEPDGLDLMEPRLVRLHTVQRQPIEWTWPARLGRGKLNIVGGEPGTGKSTLMADIAARKSNGTKWPDGTRNEPGGVVILSAEDDIEDTLVPRLHAAGADLNKITVLESVSITSPDPAKAYNREVCLSDIEAIEKAILRTPDCELLIIDPVSAYINEKIDSHKNADVRSMLKPFAKMLAKHRVCGLFVTHLNKGIGGAALHRFTGSLAFVAAARSAWLVCKDPCDVSGRRRLMLCAKNNIGPDQAGLAYFIHCHDMSGDVPHIAWDDSPVNETADGALEQRKPERKNKTDAAADWLAEYLKDGKVVTADVLTADAALAGIKRGILHKSRDEMGVVTEKSPEDNKWYVSLPA